MILSHNGFTRVSLLEVAGRTRRHNLDGSIREDWLLVNFNGNICKVGLGFSGTTDETFNLPQLAKVRHMVIDERSATEYLRFPIFEGFDFREVKEWSE